MIRQVIAYFKAWLNGDDAELNIDREFTFSWFEIAAILVIIGLIVYWVW